MPNFWHIGGKCLYISGSWLSDRRRLVVTFSLHWISSNPNWKTFSITAGKTGMFFKACNAAASSGCMKSDAFILAQKFIVEITSTATQFIKVAPINAHIELLDLFASIGKRSGTMELSRYNDGHFWCQYLPICFLCSFRPNSKDTHNVLDFKSPIASSIRHNILYKKARKLEMHLFRLTGSEKHL